MKLARLIGFVSLAFAATAAIAQMPAEIPKELKDLEWMLGEWSGKATWEFPGAPKMEAEMSFTTVWDGPFMKSTSAQDMGGMKVIETMYMAWDADKKRFSSWTFTNFAATPRIEHATMEGGNFVAISEPWSIGMPEPMISRATTIRKSDTEFEFTLELKDGETWAKAGWGTFKKKV